MSYFKKIIKIIISIFTSILLVLLALVVYGKATTVFKNTAYPNYFGYTFFSIASGSMEPTLYVNDVILVKLTDNVKEDDIITYAKNKEIITHRIISITDDTLTVKGDNNNVIDDPIKKDQIIGKVTKIFPKLSIWQKVITEPKILATIFVTFLLFDFALSYKGSEEKEEKAKPIVDNNKVINIKEKIINILKRIKEKTTALFKKIKDKFKKKKEIKIETPIVEEKNEIAKEEKTEIIIEVPTEKENIEILDTPLKVMEVESKKEPELDKTVILNFDDLDKYIKDKKEEDPFGYTVRLDLNEINKKIKNKVK